MRNMDFARQRQRETWAVLKKAATAHAARRG